MLHRLRLLVLLRYDAELLLQARRGGRVLEGELLLREDVAVHLLGRERAFVEAGEDELELARVVVDVADREDAGGRGLELLGVDRDQSGAAICLSVIILGPRRKGFLSDRCYLILP